MARCYLFIINFLYKSCVGWSDYWSQEEIRILCNTVTFLGDNLNTPGEWGGGGILSQGRRKKLWNFKYYSLTLWVWLWGSSLLTIICLYIQHLFEKYNETASARRVEISFFGILPKKQATATGFNTKNQFPQYENMWNKFFIKITLQIKTKHLYWERQEWVLYFSFLSVQVEDIETSITRFLLLSSFFYSLFHKTLPKSCLQIHW